MKNMHEEQYLIIDAETGQVIRSGDKNSCIDEINRRKGNFLKYDATLVSLAKVIPFPYIENSKTEEIEEPTSSTIYSLVIRIGGKYGPSIYNTKDPKLVEICAYLNNAMGIFGVNVEFEVRLH